MSDDELGASTREGEEDEEDVGLAGGGGPAGTLPDRPGPADEDLHRPDTDHRER
jgi:hypothetical protein